MQYTQPLICVSTNSRRSTQTHNSNLTIPTPLCWVMALLTSSVISLCTVHTTFDLCKYKLKTDSQLKPDNASPSLLRYDPVNLWCCEFVWSLLYTTFDLWKYKQPINQVLSRHHEGSCHSLLHVLLTHSSLLSVLCFCFSPQLVAQGEETSSVRYSIFFQNECQMNVMVRVAGS